MKYGVLVLILISCCFPAALRADPLHGRIETKNAATRLMRPAMPSRPDGEALESVTASGRQKSGVKLTASSVAGILDKQSFDFARKADDKQEGAVQSGDRELVIEWERWHQNLSGILYHYWLNYSTVPGEGTVRLVINREGNIEFDLQNFYIKPSEEVCANQRELFDRSLSRTFSMAAHSEEIQFPEGSHRTEVTLTCKFTHTMGDGSGQGYDWKHGDYERVRSAH